MIALVAMLWGGCGSAPEKPEIQIHFPPEGEPGEPCPLADRIGGFEIAALDGYSAVSGVVAQAVLPITVHEEVGREGDCVLLQKWNPFCDPPCQAGELCDDTDDNPATNGECAPYPPTLDAGAVHVRGLVEDVSIEADGAGNYSETNVPHPVFEPASHVQLYAEGADAETFSMDAEGVELIETPGNWSVSPDTALEVTWTPSDGPGRIWISLNVDQHGNSPMTLFCDVEDTGATTIPAALVTDLISNGVSGFATGLIRRRTVDSVEIAQGCVELLVFSHLRTGLVCEGCL